MLLLWHTRSENIEPNFSREDDEQLLQLFITHMEKEISRNATQLIISPVVQKFIKDEKISELTQLVLTRKNELFSYAFQYVKTITEICSITIKINSFFDILIGELLNTYWNIYREEKIFLQESHQERLTLLGQISASFIHEFRNPLTSVMGFVKLLQIEGKEIPYLDIIDSELQQLNEKVSQFLTVSKKDTSSETEQFLLHPLLDEIISFLYPKLLSGNVTVMKPVENYYLIRGMQSQIRQVLLNVLINSIDALQLKEGKRIIAITVEEKMGLLELTIKNNGPMIPPNKVKSIFDPFVTTKEHGTGIGLFVCKQIMKKHGGDITCESNEHWTSFSIQL